MGFIGGYWPCGRGMSETHSVSQRWRNWNGWTNDKVQQ